MATLSDFKLVIESQTKELSALRAEREALAQAWRDKRGTMDGGEEGGQLREVNV